MSAREERIKLHANFANGMAIATFAIGALAPLVSNLLRGDAAWSIIGLIVLVSSATSLIMHWAATRFLERLDI